MAAGILAAPDPGFDPAAAEHHAKTYTAGTHAEGKRENKPVLQKMLGLFEDDKAPVFFWPSRLDPVQKGCQLLADIFYSLLEKYSRRNLQVVFVADGDYRRVFRDIVNFHGLHKRVAVCDFSE